MNANVNIFDEDEITTLSAAELGGVSGGYHVHLAIVVGVVAIYLFVNYVQK